MKTSIVAIISLLVIGTVTLATQADETPALNNAAVTAAATAAAELAGKAGKAVTEHTAPANQAKRLGESVAKGTAGEGGKTLGNQGD